MAIRLVIGGLVVKEYAYAWVRRIVRLLDCFGISPLGC
jgi:hypothetical protein